MSNADDTDTDEFPSVKLDVTQPSIARSYDAVLGGKDNYEIDRKVRDQLLAAAPELGKLAWDNREFLIRVTRYIAGSLGISQFLDCGSGLPTVENTHEAAQRVNPEAIVVYVDNDPMVIVHGQALLVENERTHFAAADFSDPEAVLHNESVVKHLDFDQPLALYHIGTLHHLPDEARPDEIMAANIAALPSGSYVALSHFYNPGDEDPELSALANRLEDSFLNSPMASGRFRTRAELMRYFDGLELVEPGLVVLEDWWPDGPRLKPRDPVQRLMVGAVGRKP
ncbi:MAG: hypothetical protein GEU98_08500 [Pseudonocardiaceae bacterium]|nr:hypothetical protein [Pseudonocardiaceae bacterium]